MGMFVEGFLQLLDSIFIGSLTCASGFGLQVLDGDIHLFGTSNISLVSSASTPVNAIMLDIFIDASCYFNIASSGTAYFQQSSITTLASTSTFSMLVPALIFSGVNITNSGQVNFRATYSEILQGDTDPPIQFISCSWMNSDGTGAITILVDRIFTYNAVLLQEVTIQESSPGSRLVVLVRGGATNLRFTSIDISVISMDLASSNLYLPSCLMEAESSLVLYAGIITVDQSSTIVAPNDASMQISTYLMIFDGDFTHPSKSGGNITIVCENMRAHNMLFNNGAYLLAYKGSFVLTGALRAFNSIPGQPSTFLNLTNTFDASTPSSAANSVVSGWCVIQIQGEFQTFNAQFLNNVTAAGNITITDNLLITGMLELQGDTHIIANSITLGGDVTSVQSGIDFGVQFTEGFDCSSRRWNASTMVIKSDNVASNLYFDNPDAISITAGTFLGEVCINGPTPQVEFIVASGAELYDPPFRCHSDFEGTLSFRTGVNLLNGDYSLADAHIFRGSTLVFNSSLHLLHDIEGGILYPSSGCHTINYLILTSDTQYHHSISAFPDGCEFNSVISCTTTFAGLDANLIVDVDGGQIQIPASGPVRLDLVLGPIGSAFAPDDRSFVSMINDREFYIDDR